MDTILDYLKTTFGTPDTGAQWGAVGGTMGLAALGGLLGFAFSNGGWALALIGLLAGGVGGALLGDKFNTFGNQFLNTPSPSNTKTTLPRLPTNIVPDKDVSQRYDVVIEQPGQNTSVTSYVEVPNIERFNSAANLSKSLADQRQELRNMPQGDERIGFVKDLESMEDVAGQLLSNAQEWNHAASEWEKPGGERERLIASLKKSKEALGIPFNEKTVPKPPKIELNIPDLGDKNQAILSDLRNYAIRVSGKGEDAWNETYKTPQAKLNYVANKIDDEIRRGEPDWNKMGSRVLGDRVLTVPSTDRRISDWATSEKQNDFVRNKTDCIIVIKESLQKQDWDRAAYFAEEGRKFAEKDFDKEAEEQFDRAKNYVHLHKMRDKVDILRRNMDKAIVEAERAATAEFPQFIAKVAALETDVNQTNHRLAQMKSATTQETRLADASAATTLPGKGMVANAPMDTKEKEAAADAQLSTPSSLPNPAAQAAANGKKNPRKSPAPSPGAG